MKISRFIPKILFSVVFIAGVLLICWPALYNGYPLVYSDSGTYLRNSIELIPGADRPIGYGLFIRIFSWQAITWNVIFAQGIIVWAITYRVFKLHLKKPLFYHFLSLVILSVSSSLPWYAGQLMPDIFAGVVVLLIYLLFFDTPDWKHFLVYGILLCLLVITHFSYFVIAALMTGIFVICKLRRIFTTDRTSLYRTLGIACTMAVALLVVCTWNYIDRGKFKFSFSSNVFLTAKFSDGDILNTYLRDNCGKKDIPFCSMKDAHFNPMDFIWNSELEFQKKYNSNWEKVNDECAVIVHDVFTTAKYRNLFLKEAWRSTIQQLKENKIGSGLIQYKSLEGPPGDIISKKFEPELNQFLFARQQNENMEQHGINKYINMILLISVMIAIGGILYRPVRKKVLYIVIACICGVIVNAFVTAALANVYDRLQARITWLLEFAAILVLIMLFVELFQKREIKS